LSNKKTVLYLASRDVEELFTMPLAIDAMKKALNELSDGHVEVPLRMHLDIPQFQGVELIKPVYSPVLNQLALKVISLYKNNPAKGLPYSHAIVILMDAQTGLPLAIMEGDYLTAMRTGAASGLATDLLADKNATTAAIFGAGVQGRKQLEAILAIRPLKNVYVFDPNPDKINKFIHDMNEISSLNIHTALSEDILKNVQIICTATTSEQPVFSHNRIPAGVHINGAGSFKPETREIPSETIGRAKLVVDQREACLNEAGDIIIPITEGRISGSHIYAELGEIAAGRKAGRENKEEITVFKSVGNAIQDLLAAHTVYNLALEKGKGVRLPL